MNIKQNQSLSYYSSCTQSWQTIGNIVALITQFEWSILTVSFQCNRLRKLSCHGLVTRFHSERQVSGVKAQTLHLKHKFPLWVTASSAFKQRVYPQSSSYLWECAPFLVSPPLPSRGNPPWCAVDPHGSCVDAPVCSGQSYCRALVKSRERSLCCHTPDTLRPGSLEWLGLERRHSLFVRRNTPTLPLLVVSKHCAKYSYTIHAVYLVIKMIFNEVTHIYNLLWRIMTQGENYKCSNDWSHLGAELLQNTLAGTKPSNLGELLHIYYSQKEYHSKEYFSFLLIKNNPAYV